MASPIQSGKQPVNLAPSRASGSESRPASTSAPSGPKVSRIRRDPQPPADRVTVVRDRDERDRWTVAIGIFVFTLAILAIICGLDSVSTLSPSERGVHKRLEGWEP